MNEKPSKWKVFTAGIIRENPVLRLVLPSLGWQSTRYAAAT